MRLVYLIAAICVTVIVVFNGPRIPWIDTPYAATKLFSGFYHGMIGFSYMATWTLLVGGAYTVLLGIFYWDMDLREHLRWQFTMETAYTGRVLMVAGVLGLILGVLYAIYVFTHDRFLWPCGIASSVVAIIAMWLYWLAFPLMEQVGIDRSMIES